MLTTIFLHNQIMRIPKQASLYNTLLPSLDPFLRRKYKIKSISFKRWLPFKAYWSRSLNLINRRSALYNSVLSAFWQGESSFYAVFLCMYVSTYSKGLFRNSRPCEKLSQNMFFLLLLMIYIKFNDCCLAFQNEIVCNYETI